MIRIVAYDAKGYQQRFPLQKDRILPPLKDVREDLPRTGIDHMPGRFGRGALGTVQAEFGIAESGHLSSASPYRV
jgi:hypothetical protein